MSTTQLDPRDNAYLALDTFTTTGNVSLLLSLDGRVTRDRVRDQVAASLSTLPQLRQRVLYVAGTDRPWWADDPVFDVNRHVTETVLPTAGERGLSAVAATLAAERLDRTHPLWAVHVIQRPGFKDIEPTTAILVVVHHAVGDGAEINAILNAWFGVKAVADPSSLPEDTWTPQDPPSDAELAGRAWMASAQWWADHAARLQEQWSNPRHASAVHIAPKLPFNKAVSRDRVFAFGSVDLADCTDMRARRGMSVNDVYNAAVAGAMRRWLAAADQLPGSPLVALFPMSTRTRDDDDPGANRIGVASCLIPTHLADAGARLAAAHEAIAEAKSAPLMDEDDLVVATRALAGTLEQMAQAASFLRVFDSAPPSYNMLVSSVPLGNSPFRIGDRTVTTVHPMPPVFDGVGLNVTSHGYLGRLHVGVFADAALEGDAWDIVRHFVDSYAELCAL